MTESTLSELQLSRAEALDRARSVLVSRGFAAAGKLEFPHEATGLAQFILTGKDVFNAETELRSTDGEAAVAE